MFKPLVLATGLALLVTLFACPAPAADNAFAENDLRKLSLEQLMSIEVQTVYSASKYEQKVAEAPSSVTIITSSDIKKYGYRTLADVLRSVRSFSVTYDRNYSYVGVRGFGRPGDYNGRILLLIDGHRTNDNVYDQAFVGTEAILDVDLIDRVEVIRGPGSSLYGSNAFFAVVNVITKRGRDLQGVEASAEAGSYGAYKERLSYGGRPAAGLEALVSASGFDRNGEQRYFREFDPANPSSDPRARDSGLTAHTDYDRFKSFFTRESYQDIAIEAAYVERTKGIPTAAFGTDFNDPGNKTTDGHAYADVKYEHALGGRTELSARLYYDSYWYEGHYIYSGVTTKDLGYGDWWGGEAKLSFLLFDVHRVIAGVEYTDNIRQDQKNYDVDPFVLNLDDKRRSKIWASYLQDEFAVGTNTLVNAGVRYDHYSTFGGTVNPRLAFIYSPAKESAVKLLYGTAFRTPNVFELYYSTPPVNLPNPNLKPEKIATYELVYEQRLGEAFGFTASAFYYQIKDLINQVDTGAGGTMFQNIDQVSARGAEAEIHYRRPNGAEGRASYTIQRAEDRLTGEPLTNSPAQLAKLNVSLPVFGKKIFAGVEEQYTSRRRTEEGHVTEGFAVTNLTVFTQHLIDRLELSASVYNLFNRGYSDPVSQDLLPLDTVRQDGRTYRVKATYLF